MPAAERVVITIEVDADTAQIEAMRQALRRLSGEMEDLNDENERLRDTTKEVREENTKTTKDHDRLGNAMRRAGNSSRLLKGRYAGLLKQTFAFRQDMGKLIGAFGGVIGMVNKLALIELPLLAGGMVLITALFKSGTGFVKLYRAAMSSLAYGFAAAGVALTTFIAAQREFQAAQVAPMYAEGSMNTADRLTAASQAMDMFINRSTLAVAGTKSLQSAFTTLSKQAPVTGQTVAAFEGLMNIVAGSGGDIGKNTEKLAEFFAKVQKSGLGGAGAEAKALGADFEKIIKEAQALGIKTQEEFFKAAAEGNLGKTFQKNYAGQLELLNNTLIGRFKTTMAGLKALLQDLGQEFLGPAGDAVEKIGTTLKVTIIRLAPILNRFGTNKFFKDAESFVQKASDLLVNMVNKYINTTPTFFQQIKSIFDKISGGFEKMQDWARQFVPAGQMLIDKFFGPLFEGLMDKFGGGMNFLADLISMNGDDIEKFAGTMVKFIGAIGDYANMLKRAFVDALPALDAMVKGATKVFEIFTKIMNRIMDLGGKGGTLVKAVTAILAIYASLTIFGRFFKTLGGMFGKNMTVRANNVFVNGSPVGGAPMGPVGAGGPAGYTGAPITAPQGAGYRGTMYQRMQSSFRSGNQRFGNYMRNSPMMPMGLIAAGQLFNYTGSHIGGGGGTLVSGAGNALTAGAAANMMGIGKMNVKGKPLQKMLGGKQVGGAQLIAGAVGAGYAAKGTTDLIQDLSGGKLGKDDALGRLGMTAAGAGAGAAAGAAIGATVGGPLAPVTAAAGAIIGTLIGGTIGFINSGKYQKQARQAGKEIMETYTSSMEDAFAAGDIEALATAREEMIKQHKTNLQTITDQAEYAKSTAQLNSKLAQFDSQVVTFTRNADMAQSMMRMGTDELNKLANEAGVNLRNKVLSFRDVLMLSGRNMTQLAGIVRSKWSELTGQITTGAMSRLEKARQEREAVAGMNAAQEAIVGGDTSAEQIDNLISQSLLRGTAKYGEAGGAASAFAAISQDLQMGLLSNLDQASKDKIMARLNEVIGPEQVLGDLRTGLQEDPELLSKLLGGTASLRGLSSEDILNKIAASQDPLTFLANLQNAGQSAALSGNYSKVEELLNVGSKIGNVTTNRGFTGGTADRRERFVEKTLSPTTKNYQVTTTVNAPMLTPQTVTMIEAAIQKAIRDSQERGGTPSGDDRYK